ncbi:MAG: hypothetical protein JWQ09_6032 [Segetibacter sp.]|nr:hypothetical protein [Segetibacter sp.]
MEALFFIALVVIIILLFNIKSLQKDIASRTRESFLLLKKELQEIKDATKYSSAKEQPLQPTDEEVIQWRPYSAPETIPPVEPEHVETIATGKAEEIFAAFPNTPAAEAPIETISNPEPQSQPVNSNEGWWDKWLSNNPDLEKFIGENLINKIGITVLVLGIAFFVKYAIDQNWIREAGRVSIGIGCGIILVGVAHYLRNSYRSFSSVLAGGGIAVFYFTIAFAFHQYQLFSQTAAFIIMVVITLFAVILSLLYNKLELAVIAVIGGFITPFLVSTGSGNYIILFTYLVILDIGMLALAYFKKWQAINIIALFFTLCIYGGWLIQNAAFLNEFTAYRNALLFATAFYVLFLAMSMVYNIRKQQAFNSLDFSLLMVITFSYYAAGMTNLHFWNSGEYQGLFTIAVGLINFMLASYFYKLNKGDKNLVYLLIGLTLTFISLAAPVQLHGHTITLFWSAEFVLLYWLHQRSGIREFKYSSFIIMILMLLSLLMDWVNANDFNSAHLAVIYKSLQGFITNVVAISAFIAYGILLRKEENSVVYVAGVKNKTAATAMILLAATILYLTCVFGVNLYFYTYQSLDVPNTWHQLISFLFTALLLFILARYQLSVNTIWWILLIAACIVLYLFSIGYVIHLRNGVLQDVYPAVQLWIHWLADIVLLYLVYRAITLYRENNPDLRSTANLFIWLINIVLIAFFSVECMHIYIYLTASIQPITTSIQQYSKAGLTIVWAICSFAIMWQGMKHRYKILRIVSLVLFSVALIKLFLFDIRNISEGGKIAAFIMLGILLLIISFMYQKLKKIIIDDGLR